MDLVYGVTFLFLAIIFLTSVYFCWILYNTLNCVPKSLHVFPSWFVWLFLVPWVGLIFQWIMLPFGIPKTLEKNFPRNEMVATKTNTLFKIGLAQVILMTASFFAIHSPAEAIIGIAGVACWVSYWILIVRFKKQFLQEGR